MRPGIRLVIKFVKYRIKLYRVLARKNVIKYIIDGYGRVCPIVANFTEHM
jgi:hypothetical protein